MADDLQGGENLNVFTGKGDSGELKEAEELRGSPSTSVKNEDESAEGQLDSESEDERESFYKKYAHVYENWRYSDEERKWLRYKVETLTRNECLIFYILGHIMMDKEEMQGPRYTLPMPDDARQALLSLTLGSQWDVKNLAVLMAFHDKVTLVEQYISSTMLINQYKARQVIKNILLKTM